MNISKDSSQKFALDVKFQISAFLQNNVNCAEATKGYQGDIMSTNRLLSFRG